MRNKIRFEKSKIKSIDWNFFLWKTKQKRTKCLYCILFCFVCLRNLLFFKKKKITTNFLGNKISRTHTHTQDFFPHLWWYNRFIDWNRLINWWWWWWVINKWNFWLYNKMQILFCEILWLITKALKIYWK